MKKQYLKCIFVFILFLMLMVPNKAFAITSDDDYVIKNYNIDMVVNENNTFDITEEITVYFSIEKHRNI